jgi:prepilin peptidase CpaA
LPSFYEELIITISSCVLLFVTFDDIQNYRIKNEHVLLLAVLYFIYVFITGTWGDVPYHLGIATLIFIVLLVCYNYGMLGGGDVKLLTVAFLWTGKDCALLFAIVMLAITGVHAGLVYLGLLRAQTVKGRQRIPYAPAIAGALVVVFVSGCLHGSM